MVSPPAPAAVLEPDLVLLLQGDPADPVSRVLLQGRLPLDWPLLSVSAAQLLADVTLGETWTVGSRQVDPARTALINRLPLSTSLLPGDATPADLPGQQAVWARLRLELGRCGYASSLPTASSLMGCHGSLLDQWQDLPRLVPGLQVPEHATAARPRALRGRVHAVNRWKPYSLGHPTGQAQAAALPADVRLDYSVPNGALVHLVQVGPSMFFPHLPPGMVPAQQQAMIDVVLALAKVSPLRIAEHAFFVGSGAPVLYSRFPVPVLGGAHPLFPELVQQGLRNDIRTWRGQRSA